MKQTALFLVLAVCLCLTLGATRSAAQSPTPTPAPIPTPTPIAEMTPDDPRYDDKWARILELQKSWRYEDLVTPKMPLAVVLVFGESLGDCSHPDLQANCLAAENFNATDQTPDEVVNPHDLGPASIVAAGTNNAIGPASVAGKSGRVKVAFYKVGHKGLFRIEWLQKAFRRVLERKSQGLPIVALNFSFITGDSDPGVTEPLLLQIKDASICIFGPGPTASSPINMDMVDNMFPASYSRRYNNIVTVTALKQDGTALTDVSPTGAQTIAFAGPGENVQTVSMLDKINSSSSFSGTSPATAHITAEHALVRALVEPDWAKALELQKSTAVMIPALQGKVGSGIPNVYAALTFKIGCSSSSDIMWVTEVGTNKAVALNALLHSKGPFSVDEPVSSLNPTGRAALKMFVTNISLLPGEDLSAFKVQAEDSAGKIFQLPVEYVGKLYDQLPCVYQVDIRLVSNLSPGEVFLTLTLRDKSSTSKAVIAIK